MTRLNIPDDVPIESKIVSNAIRSAQHQVEQQNFEIRKNVLKYDEVLNRQRKVIYAERRRVLEGADLHEQIERMIDEVVAGYVTAATAEGFAEEWDLDKLWKAFKQLYPISLTSDELVEEAGGKSGLTAETAHRADRRRRPGRLRQARGGARRRGPARAGAPRHPVGPRPQVARAPLRDGLPPGGHRPAGDGPARPAGRIPARGLRHVHRDARGHQGGVGRLPVQPRGRDRRRGARRVAGVGTAPVQVADSAEGSGDEEPETEADETPEIVAKGLGESKRPQSLSYSAPTVDGEGGVETKTEDDDDPYATATRNDPCPCGSGKKFKRCHGDPRKA